MTGALLRVPADGGAPVEANLGLSGLDNLRVSPDGTKLLVTALHVVSEIWKIDRLVPSR